MFIQGHAICAFVISDGRIFHMVYIFSCTYQRIPYWVWQMMGIILPYCYLICISRLASDHWFIFSFIIFIPKTYIFTCAGFSSVFDLDSLKKSAIEGYFDVYFCESFQVTPPDILGGLYLISRLLLFVCSSVWIIAGSCSSLSSLFSLGFCKFLGRTDLQLQDISQKVLYLPYVFIIL